MARDSFKGGLLHNRRVKMEHRIALDEVFKKTHVKKKENKSNPNVWVEERAERTFNDVRRLQSGLKAKLTAALAKSERRRVTERQSMSETVQQIKEQVINLTRRPTTSAPDDTDDESDEEDYVDLTP
ncbi:hypothetical protein H5410_012095 [Solanum commersonii]|uniref:Uncharacterized protein n=1 Tax=Solanum commersonii TaxID=4109 RepID=A0A9J6AQI8_SOLCO|nr:hypothetical protein H5410_012095 [Solanum commersonii]